MGLNGVHHVAKDLAVIQDPVVMEMECVVNGLGREESDS
jgi:hypothetical protein